MKKKNGIVFTFESLLMVIFILIVFAGGVTFGHNFVINYRIDKTKNDCVAIDNALEMYSLAHQSVQSNTVKVSSSTGQLSYTKSRVYPANLTELGLVQNTLGYFTTNIDLSNYKYSVTTNSNGIMTYQLGVTLPNGTYYKSPGSDQ